MIPLPTANLATPWVAPAHSSPATKRGTVTPLLHRFSPITLNEMADVTLLNRMDTKYLIPATLLPQLLLGLASHYRILEIGGTRVQAYRTLYFDTPDFELYHRHHAGGRNRYKIRSRAYLNSDLAFLEVKLKTNKKQTIKSRVRTPQLATQLTAEGYTFLADHYPFNPAALEPKLYNDYSRISLVSKRHQERLTLDLDIQFWQGEQQSEVAGIVVAELKQASRTYISPLTEMMRDLHLRDGSFSKYAMGATLLYPALKQNRFKEEHRRIAKLQEGCVA